MSHDPQQQAPIEGQAWEPDVTSDYFLVAANQDVATPAESPDIIRLNIEHYRALLKLNCVAERIRTRITRLLAEAMMQLRAAEAGSPAVAVPFAVSDKSNAGIE